MALGAEFVAHERRPGLREAFAPGEPFRRAGDVALVVEPGGYAVALRTTRPRISTFLGSYGIFL